VKIVLADGLAPQVDAAFARQANSLGSLDVWLMAVGFGLQIYLDFSSYSRIAIGSSKLCGLELVENFDFPYGARNPVEFWAKWHMSLSRWIRDYLFYPLVGKKATLGALVRAAIVSMVLCGIWHGAGWTFVLWGGYHGLLIAAYHLIAGWRKRRGGAARVGESVLGGVLATLGTFSVVSLGWLLFRSTNLGQAVALIGRAMSPWAHPERALPGTLYLFVGCTLALVWLAPGLQRMARSAWQRAEATPRGVLAWHIGAGAVLGLSAVFGLMYLRGQTSFIYFQF
jgi:alginate O-acetyltransferase complex protein AlgI